MADIECDCERAFITAVEAVESGVDTDYFRHWYTNFGHTNLGMP